MRRPCHAVPCRLDQLLPESHLLRKVPHWKRRMISMLKLRNSSVYPLLCCVVSNMWWYSPMTNNNRGWHWWAHYYPGIGDSYVGSLWYRHHTTIHRTQGIFRDIQLYMGMWGHRGTWLMTHVLDCNAETEPMFHVSVFNILFIWKPNPPIPLLQVRVDMQQYIARAVWWLEKLLMWPLKWSGQ